MDAIQKMKETCASTTEVRIFLGACVFYLIWLPHFAHVAELLYQLLRKGQRFASTMKHSKAISKLKTMLLSAPTLRKIEYKCGRPVIVTVDTSPTGIGWAIGQDDEEGKRYAARFGAKVLSERQRDYPQIKRELWGVVTALKNDREYLIGAEVIVETECLPLLGMITSCSTPDIAMLRWIAYIKSLCPEFCHIAGRDNPVANMLSRVRFEDEEEMISMEEDVGLKFYKSSHASVDDGFIVHVFTVFSEEEYDGEWLLIGHYLSTLNRPDGWSDQEYRRIQKKAYGYFLKDGHLWKHPKQRRGAPERVICDKETQQKIIKEFHENLWAGHRGVWATFTKIKERYWWKGMHKDVTLFVESCTTCQMHSTVRHRDGLHPTYPLVMHFKWVVDLVTMPVGLWRMRYIVLAREDLTNQVEGRALRNNTTQGVCTFLLEDVICRYGCIGKITADRGELDADEAREFFDQIGVKLALTTAYNPEGNGKSERGHPPIVKALAKACEG